MLTPAAADLAELARELLRAAPWYVLGLVFLVPGLALIIWGRLKKVPARGRALRGCAQCRYDMRNLPGTLTCPECGHAHVDEKALLPLRRRRWPVALGVLLVLGCFALWPAQIAVRQGKWALLPSWVGGMWLAWSDDPPRELYNLVPLDGLYDWQFDALARRAHQEYMYSSPEWRYFQQEWRDWPQACPPLLIRHALRMSASADPKLRFSALTLAGFGDQTCIDRIILPAGDDPDPLVRARAYTSYQTCVYARRQSSQARSPLTYPTESLWVSRHAETEYDPFAAARLVELVSKWRWEPGEPSVEGLRNLARTATPAVTHVFADLLGRRDGGPDMLLLLVNHETGGDYLIGIHNGGRPLEKIWATAWTESDQQQRRGMLAAAESTARQPDHDSPYFQKLLAALHATKASDADEADRIDALVDLLNGPRLPH